MTRNRSLLAVVFALFAAPAFAAGSLPEPVSYSKPVAGGKFTFVQLGDPAAEAKQSASIRKEFAQLREKYPRSGLYPADSPNPAWTLDAPYAPYDNTYPSADGVHLARIKGEAWIEQNYPGGKRLPADVEQKQYDAPAVGFYANGKLTRSYPLRDLITNPLDVKHSPQFVLWAAGSVLNEDTGRFVVMTQDATRVTFDVNTGEILKRDRVGLNNPILSNVLLACAAMTALVLAAWAWFAFRFERGRKRVAVRN